MGPHMHFTASLTAQQAGLSDEDEPAHIETGDHSYTIRKGRGTFTSFQVRPLIDAPGRVAIEQTVISQEAVVFMRALLGLPHRLPTLDILGADMDRLATRSITLNASANLVRRTAIEGLHTIRRCCRAHPACIVHVYQLRLIGSLDAVVENFL